MTAGSSAFFSSFLPQQGVPGTFQGRNDVRIPKPPRDLPHVIHLPNTFAHFPNSHSLLRGQT